MNNTEKELRKAKNLVFGGAMALQATPLLRASGRTPAAMAGTAAGFVGLGVAGFAAGAAFEMVKAPGVLAKKKKRKGR